MPLAGSLLGCYWRKEKEPKDPSELVAKGPWARPAARLKALWLGPSWENTRDFLGLFDSEAPVGVSGKTGAPVIVPERCCHWLGGKLLWRPRPCLPLCLPQVPEGLSSKGLTALFPLPSARG